MESSERSGTWTNVTDDNIDEFMEDVKRNLERLEALQLRRNNQLLQNTSESVMTNKDSNLLHKDSSKDSQTASDSFSAQLENNNSLKNKLECSSGKLPPSGSGGNSKSFPKTDPNFVPTVPLLIPKKCPLSRVELSRIARSLPRIVIRDDSDSSDDEENEVSKDVAIEEENLDEDGILLESEDAESDNGQAEKVAEENDSSLSDGEDDDGDDDDDDHPEVDISPVPVEVPVPAKVLGIKGPSSLKEYMHQTKPQLPQHPKPRQFSVPGIVKSVGVPQRPLHHGNFGSQPKRFPPIPSVRGAKTAKPSTVQPAKFISSVPQTAPNEQITVNEKCYNIMQLLGSGGSSKVHLVCESTSNDLFAIKCVDLTNAEYETCQGYLNEIKLLQKLQGSDRIVKMHDFEHKVNEKFLYVVMEHGDTDLASYVNGILRRGEKLGHEMIRFYWSEMLKAVQVIHNAGIIHSDLKPANFLLVKGCLKLIDFGIASAIQPDMTSVIRNNMVGTFNYISPEALRCTKQDGPITGAQKKDIIKIGVKADVWSLGCILYSWVYGKTPFQHITNLMQKHLAILSDAHIISFPDLADKQLLDVLKKCLVRDRKYRASTQELLQHPYLTSTSSVATEEMRNPKNLLAHISSSLQLTPRRQQKLDEIIDSLH